MKHSVAVVVGLAIGLVIPARAEVQSLTLGITMNCPYGLGG